MAFAGATPQQIDDPGGTYFIDTADAIVARARSGGSGFKEVIGITDLNPGTEQYDTKTFNWSYGSTYSLSFNYISTTGTATLNVTSPSSTIYTVSNVYDGTPPLGKAAEPNYVGNGFQYIHIVYRGGTSGTPSVIKEVQIDNLTINSTNFGSFDSGSAFNNLYFKDSSGLFGNISITGSFVFTGAVSQEQPAIYVELGGPSPPAVPLPGAVLLLGAGMVRLVAYARRRREEQV